MENSNSTIVAILGLSLTVSFVMLIMMYLLLNQIRHSIESIIAEFRKNANMQSKAFDRNFAEVNGELKKISYRLENIAEEMHRIPLPAEIGCPEMLPQTSDAPGDAPYGWGSVLKE